MNDDQNPHYNNHSRSEFIIPHSSFRIHHSAFIVGVTP